MMHHRVRIVNKQAAAYNILIESLVYSFAESVIKKVLIHSRKHMPHTFTDFHPFYPNLMMDNDDGRHHGKRVLVYISLPPKWFQLHQPSHIVFYLGVLGYSSATPHLFHVQNVHSQLKICGFTCQPHVLSIPKVVSELFPVINLEKMFQEFSFPNSSPFSGAVHPHFHRH
jgi:hypothetical protein